MKMKMKMKREGWQHGMVRNSKAAAATAAATTGPANGKGTSLAKHTADSRLTGRKCRRARCAACRSRPVSKSRDKAKGAHKLRSRDVALNHRLVSWRVAPPEGGGSVRRPSVERHPGAASASGILDQLSERDYREDYGDETVDEDRSMDVQSDAKDEEEDDDEVGFVWEYIDGDDWCVVHEM